MKMAICLQNRTIFLNYFSQIFNVYSFSDVKQIEINRAESLVPDFCPSEVEILIVNLKKHKSPCSDQIQAELIQAEGEILPSEIHRPICSLWNKEEELPDRRKESIIAPIYKKKNLRTDFSNYRGI
jgi:hypothetical protein